MPKIINDKVKAIGSKVGATTNSKLLDDAVRHAVVLERYKKGEVAAINAFLDKEVVPELIKIAEKKLAKNAGSYSAKVVAETTFATNELLRSGMRAAGEKVSKNLGNLAVQEGRYHTAVLKTSIPVGLDMRTPSPELLRELIDTKHMGAAPLKGWFAKLGDDAAAGVAKQIRTGTAIGESVDDIVKRLVGDPAAAGAFAGEMAKVKRDASAVVRTAVNHASTQAREASYVANADVIKGVKIVATLDERTTDVCMAQDGKVYPINEGPRPPFHFNCRTTTAPVTKSWKEMAAEAENAGDAAKLQTLSDAPEGARASMKGEVPASEDYGSWLKKQPDQFQDEVLGPTKAQLFRDGKVPIDRFVDQSGKSLNLDQLAQALADAGGVLQSPPPAVLPPAGAGPVPTAPAGLPGEGAKVPEGWKPKPKAPPTPPEPQAPKPPQPPAPEPAVPQKPTAPPSPAPKKAPAVPTPAPKPQAPVPAASQEVVDADKLLKVGPQKGSNPGGTYQDPTDGSRWYVKTPANPEQARNEVLAAKLYELAGVKVPKVKLATLDGKVGVASQIVDDLKSLSAAGLKKAGAADGFAVDAWLANWDVVGMGYDNMLVDASGSILRVDTGGALRFRAKGGLKGSLFGDTVTEFETFFSSKNPQAAAVFGGMDDATLLESMKRVTAIEDAKIVELVEKYGPTDAGERKKLLDTLVARKKDVAKRQADLFWKMDAAKNAVPPPAPPTVPPPEPTPAPAVKAPKITVSSAPAPTASSDVKSSIMSKIKLANKGDVTAAQEIVDMAQQSPGAFADAAKTKKQAVKVLEHYKKNVPPPSLAAHVPGYTTPDGQPLPENILSFIRRSAPEAVPASRRYGSATSPEYIKAYRKFERVVKSDREMREAIARWKDGWYTDIREMLVFAKNSTRRAELERTLENLIKVADRAPSAERVVYRGMKIGTENARVWDELLKNDHITFNSWASSSKSKGVAEGFANNSGKQVIFKIKSKTGIDIENLAGSYKGEKEILLRAGTRFKINGRSVSGKVMTVEMEEL